jgi:RNA polymerase sigma-70 factor (ECF subfamily)
MPPDPTFRELMGRVRAGDQQAAAELVHSYGPEIRRYIRVRLSSPKLRLLLDSIDVFQSVLAVFFANVWEGRHELDDPKHLVKLLRMMARHKIVDYARKPDQRRCERVGHAVLEELPARDEAPSQVLLFEELLKQMPTLWSEDEQRLVRLRAEGRSWQEIGDEYGLNADAVRKQFARVRQRVCRDLGMDDDGDCHE